MLHFCTHSDYNYLVFGLTMFESLAKYTKVPFVLHYLADDDAAYNKLFSINDPRIKTYNIKDMASDNDFAILSGKNKVESFGQSMFHFALTPYFTNRVLRATGGPIIYVDSDILWYNDPGAIFDLCRGCDFGLATHKHMPLMRLQRNPGYYNVGVVYVSNKEQCEWWKTVSIDPSNKWARQYGSCGDQKYLEALDQVFSDTKICVIDRHVGHGAPCNMFLQIISHNEGTITWVDTDGNVLTRGETTTLPLHFFHFAHCVPDFNKNTIRVDREGEWGGHIDIKRNDIQRLYTDYFVEMVLTKRKYDV